MLLKNCFRFIGFLRSDMVAKEFLYKTELDRFCKMCDVAFDAYKRFKPEGFSDEDVDSMIIMLKSIRDDTVNAGKPYRTIKNVQIGVNMILTYFQEASGETVAFFWKEIKRLGLGYKRKNMLVKILRRSHIKDDIEYDFVKDVIMSYLDEGLITDMEFKKLNDMIFTFEQKKGR